MTRKYFSHVSDFRHSTIQSQLLKPKRSFRLRETLHLGPKGSAESNFTQLVIAPLAKVLQRPECSKVQVILCARFLSNATCSTEDVSLARMYNRFDESDGCKEKRIKTKIARRASKNTN